LTTAPIRMQASTSAENSHQFGNWQETTSYLSMPSSVDARGELAVAQAALTSGDRVEIDHGGFVRQFRAAAVEVIAHHLVTPMALRPHRVDARLGQNGIEPHLAPSARRWDRFLTQIKDGSAVSPHGYG